MNSTRHECVITLRKGVRTECVLHKAVRIGGWGSENPIDEYLPGAQCVRVIDCVRGNQYTCGDCFWSTWIVGGPGRLPRGCNVWMSSDCVCWCVCNMKVSLTYFTCTHRVTYTCCSCMWIWRTPVCAIIAREWIGAICVNAATILLTPIISKNEATALFTYFIKISLTRLSTGCAPHFITRTIENSSRLSRCKHAFNLYVFCCCS